MIIHRTTYALYYSTTDETNIISDCKRSSGNACKIYHLVENGEIKSSKLYNQETQKLINHTTTVFDTNITYQQRKIQHERK